MQSIQKSLQQIGIIPVVTIKRADNAAPLAEALLEGGVPCAEITFRTEAAGESIRRIAETFPELLLGAGTVTTPEQLETAHRAGARFIVSPGFDAALVQQARKLELPIFPGCVTPTEIMAAIKSGLDTVKYFPASLYGGAAGMKALGAPFPNLRFIPTGGVGADNLRETLSFNKTLACGGSWMINDSLRETTRLCREARKIVLEVRG